MSIKSLSVSVPAARVAYAATADLDPGFEGIASGYVNSLAPADVIFVSFDGVNDATQLIPGTASTFCSSNPYGKIWLRAGGGAGAVAVWITLESNRQGV